MLPSGATVRILQGPLRGKRWIVGASNHGCWLGSYELAKQTAFYASVSRGDVVYDLGANVGFYSLLASVGVGPTGRVLSFEPLPRNLAYLRRHLDMNLTGNCTVISAAVGSSDGTAEFEVGPDNHVGHLASNAPQSLRVATVTLDALVLSGEIPPPNLIKCDIEGGEYDALQGAAGTLERHAPTIFLATHGGEVHERCCRLLTDAHYVLESLDDHSVLMSSEILARPKRRQR